MALTHAQLWGAADIVARWPFLMVDQITTNVRTTLHEYVSTTSQASDCARAQLTQYLSCTSIGSKQGIRVTISNTNIPQW